MVNRATPANAERCPVLRSPEYWWQLINGLLAGLVAAGVAAVSTDWPHAVAVALALFFGLLVGTISRAVAVGDPRNLRGLVGRVLVGTAVGVVVGELAAVLLFSGALDRRIDEQSVSGATAAPAVVQASADLDRTRETRTALDTAVDQARGHRDEALVVARCEYNPSPACPQTQITGVPGSGPETRTANLLLNGAQQELDSALAAREARTAELDSGFTR